MYHSLPSCRKTTWKFVHTYRNITHLLRSCSRSKKVGKTLSELFHILNVVVVQRLISWLQSYLVQQCHTIHDNVHTAPEPWWLKECEMTPETPGISDINWLCRLHRFCCVKHAKYLSKGGTCIRDNVYLLPLQSFQTDLISQLLNLWTWLSSKAHSHNEATVLLF